MSGHQNKSDLTLKEMTFEQTDRDEMHNPFSIKEKRVKCDHTEAQFMAMPHDAEFAFVQQHLHHKGIKTFGEKGKEATTKELKQQHAKKCFAPVAMEASSKI